MSLVNKDEFLSDEFQLRMSCFVMKIFIDELKDMRDGKTGSQKRRSGAYVEPLPDGPVRPGDRFRWIQLQILDESYASKMTNHQRLLRRGTLSYC